MFCYSYAMAVRMGHRVNVERVMERLEHLQLAFREAYEKIL